MLEFYPIFVYLCLVLAITGVTLLLSTLIKPKDLSETKFMPYESGIKTETNLLQERFKLQHYLVALMFLVFDIEVIFLYPWAVVGKEIGPFAFYEMIFFMVVLLVGYAYVWRKGGFQWE